MIEITGLCKRYGKTDVLCGVSLRVKKAEVSVLLGPSGGGKSTLLRTINALETFDEGKIRIDDLELTANGRQEPQIRRIRQRVGMVFQQFNLFPHLTVLQNVVEAPITVLGMKRAKAEERAAELLDMVGLSQKKGHYPSQLSGGQQQRVAIARALAMRPKIMLFDEVTSALDPELVGEVLEVIRKLGREHDLTMLMVTHQMGFAKEFSDRVCFFHAGKICEQGPPSELFGAPKNERTRQFLHAVLEAG